jgi:hypothetical protein
MPPPMLDQESYQWMSSEWVVYAGQLLHQQGYLQAEPTGTYDAELAAAVDAFQAANGITYEPSQIGPYTWAALGVYDDESDAGYCSPDEPYGPFPDDGGTTTAVDPGLEVKVGKTRYVIHADEVRTGGSVAWRGRNPGNIRDGERFGAYPGKKVTTTTSGSFAVFPDEETGFEAIKLVLKGYGHITVTDTMKKYAPEGDGANDPVAYAENVAKAMGVPAETYIDTLDDDQLEVFATAIKRFEGWVVGTIYALDDDSLPAEVKKAIRGY